MTMNGRIVAPDLGLVKAPEGFDPKNLNWRIKDRLSSVSSPHLAEAVATAVRTSSILRLKDSSRTPEAFSSSLTTALREFKYHWRHPWPGNQTPYGGACTGFSGLKKFLAGPVTHSKDRLRRLGVSVDADRATFNRSLDNLAAKLYNTAQGIDRAEGRNYPEGATMLALAKAGVQLGLWRSYYWGYTLEEYLQAVKMGPVLLGIWWRSMMDEPDRRHGIIRYRGSYRGGHSIVSDGVNDWAGRFDQTWTDDRSFGDAEGYCQMPLEEIAQAIADDGEILVTEE